ncbi:hypothetical protein HDC94_000098 [Leifsonia sp. AK011]|uniref:cell wall-binding repeat-containing protein n=1 Tax=Leifsonia sp. AK011 TaxID=2723075 RepID=UPI0015CAC71D|nr:cell wall-binding repeat-containing protein [Leifsonia sp. AK011]NYF08942.1 hypothetical protein [Leifsonia sp. AK011]
MLLALTGSGAVAPAAMAGDAPEYGSITGQLSFTEEPIGSITGFVKGIGYLDESAGRVDYLYGEFDVVDGSFEFANVKPGSWEVRISATSDGVQWSPMYVAGVPLQSQAATITVRAGETSDVGTIALHRAPKVEGVISAPPGTPKVAVFYLQNGTTGEFEWFTNTVTDESGAFAEGLLVEGTYRIQMRSDPDLAPRWWPDGRTMADGQDVVLTEGQVLEFSGSLTRPRYPMTILPRIAGSDRFQTNVAVSRELFPPSTDPFEIPVAYVVSGEKFPDALVAGPAAHHEGGVVLLSRQGEIPASTWIELNRLRPKRIVVLGGDSSVSASVVARLGEIAPVERIAGANRYETSRLVAERVFACGASPCIERVFIATGRDYPDALSASAPAAKLGSPIILVDGKASALDAPSRELIYKLASQGVYIMGDSKSVSDGIEAGTLQLPDASTRIGGPNRFWTSLGAAQRFFPKADDVLLTTGLGFADALSGGPLAAAKGSPMVLTRPNCVSRGMAGLLQSLDVSRLRFLGDSNSVQDNVLDTICD